METKKQFEELKIFMRTARTVQEWNALRERAKRMFPEEAMRWLDASGYITEVLNTKEVSHE